MYEIIATQGKRTNQFLIWNLDCSNKLKLGNVRVS